MASRGSILVVDDDESILDLMQMALEDEGYEVLTAEHGAAALEVVRQRPPQLILLDLRMPVMDGWEFARAYQEMPGPHAPIVVIAAGRDGRARTSQVAADAYLDKPFDIDELVALVAKYATR